MEETTTFEYGPNEHQFVRIYRPLPTAFSCTNRDVIVFAIIHGGYFKAQYGIDNSGVSSLIPMLIERGYSVAMIEYRRVGHPGGGWPGTNIDILHALNKVYEEIANSHKDDSNHPKIKIVVVGHSAGGTLALWSCASRSKESSPTVSPIHPHQQQEQEQKSVSDETTRTLQFPVALCIAVAPIGDLEAGYHRRLSDEGDAIPMYMGGASPSDNASDKTCPYKVASPHHLLPMAAPLLVAVGTADKDVPPDLVTAFYDRAAAAEETLASSSAATCARTAAAATTAHPVLLLVIPDADHFDVMTASHSAWKQILEAAEKMLGLA